MKFKHFYYLFLNYFITSLNVGSLLGNVQTQRTQNLNYKWVYLPNRRPNASTAFLGSLTTLELIETYSM